MANTFKLKTKANIGISTQNVYVVPSATTTVVIGITLANKSSAGITASVFLDNFSGSNDVYIVKDATIPAGASLEVMSGNKLVLQGNGTANDALRISSSAASSLDATVSVLEDV